MKQTANPNYGPHFQEIIVEVAGRKHYYITTLPQVSSFFKLQIY